MSELSERVAREHHRAPWPDTVQGPVPYHLCAAGCEGVFLEDDGDTRRHVAAMTEAAVRETIAAELHDLPTSRTAGWLKAWDSISLNEALDIARGET